MTFKQLFKVKLITPSHVPLEIIQLLSETFLSAGFSFRDIWLDHLKWDTLYIYRVFQTTRPTRFFRKRDILKKNVSDKSCRVLKDLFTDFISLTLDGVAKVRSK